MSCPLCDKSTFKLYITFCWSHSDYPLIVSTTHKSEFSEEEKELIKKIFPNREIRWEMRSIPQHAHAHLSPIK